MLKIRIDKFLKVSRIIKRRTVAKEACEQNRVLINDKLAKPGDLVKVGDRIQVIFANAELKAEILEVRDNVGKDQATSLYRII